MPISTCYRLIASVLFLVQSSFVYSQNQPKTSGIDTLRLIAEEEQRRLIDPATGTVPYERLDEARRQLNSRSSTSASSPSTQSGIPNITWQERGPSNVGGRTRALLFDPNDPTHKKVWAGSPAGGLWYTNDITDLNAGWTPVSDNWENTIVTALAADPSNPQVMYAGTGEINDYQAGGGIWKTINGGTTWARLTSSIPSNTYPGANSALRYIQRIAVNSSGHVFVATQYGVVRSTDEGTNWSYILAPAQKIGATDGSTDPNNDRVSDLEIGSDNTIYVAFHPSKVYKSANGTTWANITPTDAPIGERTELALSSSTSGAGQVLYCVSRKYNNVNYGQDIGWFKKSTNGGATWTDIPIPTFSWGSHFTTGNGYNSLNLAVHPTDANTVYAGGNAWFRSTTGGTSWENPFSNNYQYQYGLWFQPGSGTNAVLITDTGLLWSTDWGDNTMATPTVSGRNNGYRVGEVSSVSMRSSAGSSYLLAGLRSSGFVQLNSADLSTGTTIWGSSYPGATFIDDDEPGIQIIQAYGGFYLYNPPYLTQLTSVTSYYSQAPIPSDYDSQSNTLYVADNTSGFSQTFIRKITGIGNTPTSTTQTLAGVTNLASYLKLSPSRTKLYLGTGSGQLYRISNLGQSTPTVTSIDNGALPQYTSISCIEVGTNDDELLVTLSNYGVQSVWYTANGGATWIGKDQTNYGLPDVPVRSILFNPQDRKQVLLATDAGIWSTNDITTTNPGWTFSGSGMGTFRVNQLRYRASDGRVTVATNGRGIWATDAFAIPYTLPAIAITNISNATLCAGNTFMVSFSTTGPSFGTGNTFEVWLSDANGNFTNKLKIGSGTASPISITLPSGSNTIPYGTNYKLKIIATNPEVESSLSGILAIGNLSVDLGVSDWRFSSNVYYMDGTICTGGSAILKEVSTNNTQLPAYVESNQWLLNDTPITGATSSTYAAQIAGLYKVIIKQAGCSVTSRTYNLAIGSSISVSEIISPAGTAPQCDDTPQQLIAPYIGATASYQWTLNDTPIAGVSSYSLAINQTGIYTVRISDGNCAPVLSPRSYFQSGRSLIVRIGQSYEGDTILCATNSSRGIYLFSQGNYLASLYIYQWYKNGLAISGAVNSSFYAYEPGTYTLAISQGTCKTYSNPIVIRLSDHFNPIIQPGYGNTCIGGTMPLTALPYNLNYQWQKDGVDIPGATTSSLNATQTGSYTVRASNGGCSGISAPTSYTFNTILTPKINYQSGTENCTSVYLNQNFSYSQSNYRYQWFKDGASIAGATYPYYQAYQTGEYTLQITSGACQGLSKGVYVTIGKPFKPVIQASGNIKTACSNGSIELSPIDHFDYYRTWKRNGVPIAVNTRFSLYATQSGFYTVTYPSFDGCYIESDPIEVKIGEPTTAILNGNALITAGQSTFLPVSFTGPAPWSFTLTNGQSVTATYQNPAFIAVSPTANTTYQLASVVNGCGTGAVSGQARVSVGTGSADVSLNMAVSNRVPNVGDVVTYTLSASNAGPQDAVGIQLSSLLPVGLTFVNSSSPGLSAANGVVSANLGTIPANSVSTISFQVTPTQPGVFATAAQIISSQTPDPDSQPNSGTGDGQDDAVNVDLRTPIDGSFVTSANSNQVPLPKLSSNQPIADPSTVDLSLAMQVDKLTPVIVQNDIVTTTLTVNNRGGSSASSVIVQVVLPNGSFNAQSPVGWIQVNSTTYKRYINALASGQSATLSLKWQPSGSGTLKAQILDVAEGDPDSTPGNGYANGEDDEASVTLRAR